ncbi:hypothetical protein ACU686_13220 [Yinghuangia aomiensis]
MGAELEAEIKKLVRIGLWRSFAGLTWLRQWQPFLDAGGGTELVQGTRHMARALTSALDAWHEETPDDARAMKVLLSVDNVRAKRILNGPDGLRTKAGEVYHVSFDQFSRRYEEPLIRSFADFVSSWSPAPETPSQKVTQLDLGDLEKASIALHRMLEQRFQPDLVITMSGPGSFAACYMMQFNTRDIPVVMAVTFPRRNVETAIERDFARAARASDGIHASTSKWSVYLPGLVRHLAPGVRIALVDDRVVSGETHILVRGLLEDLGFQVACAAMFTNGTTPIADLIVGRVIKGSFNLPWGTLHGRS